MTPKTAVAEDCFLNVIQVMDNTVTPLLVQKIDGEKVVGAAVGGRTVIFSRDGKALSEEFSFELPKAAGKKVKVLLTDLAEGVWTVTRNGKPLMKDASVTAESGTIYFDAAPGKYTIICL